MHPRSRCSRSASRASLLAIWAQPGRRIRDTLGRTLARFVVPAAIVSSLVGLLLFNGSLLLAGSATAESLDAARTALTSFLVYAGLFLIVFVEPPLAWFAVVERQTDDRRPGWLALGLAIGFIVVLLLPPARAWFSFSVPDPRNAMLVVVAVVVWLLLIRTFWQRRLVDRFLGIG